MNKLFVLNWKMNLPQKKEAENLFKTTVKLAVKTKMAEIVVCPPFAYLEKFNEILKKTEAVRVSFLRVKRKIHLGAQNCFWKESGAYTGETSPLMLKELGCSYVILGHSERRLNLNENDEMINKKIKAAVKIGLKAVLCVGEKERDADFNYFDFVKNQIENGLRGLSPRYLSNICVAYEPIWAISANKNSEADDANDISTMMVFIRKTLFNFFNSEAVFGAPTLYGGSVNENNIKKFLEIGEELNGFLMGGVSLNKDGLTKIFKNV